MPLSGFRTGGRSGSVREVGATVARVLPGSDTYVINHLRLNAGDRIRFSGSALAAASRNEIDGRVMLR